MPQIDVSSYEETDKWALLAAHFFERLDTLNATLNEIHDRLQGIEARLSYANVLDNQD